MQHLSPGGARLRAPVWSLPMVIGLVALAGLFARGSRAGSMAVYRNVPLSGTLPIVNAIYWSGQGLVATNAQRSQTNFPTALTNAPWQPTGYLGQPLSGVATAGPTGTVIALLATNLGSTASLDALRLQQPNSLPGPYSVAGLVLFSKADFANVLPLDRIILSPSNVFAGLFADVTQAPGDGAAVRWVLQDSGSFYISEAITNLGPAINPSRVSSEPMNLAWYSYDPATDLTAVGAPASPPFADISYVGFRLEQTRPAASTGPLRIGATQLRFDVTVAVPLPPRLVPLPAAQSRITDGFLDVTQAPYLADNTGATDARAAIQDAIDDAYAANLIVFFPTGTYRCDGGLSCIQTPGPTSLGQRKFAHKLVGSTLGARPVLKLTDGAVVTNALATGGGPAPPVYPVFLRFAWEGDSDNSGLIEEDPPRQYCATLRGINIDMGNNTNVSALRMLGAQYCVVEDVEIYGTNFGFGIDGLPGSGGSVSNVKITGGQIGIYHSEYRPTPLLTGVELIGQSSNAISTHIVRGPLVVAGFRIKGPPTSGTGYSAVYCNATNVGGSAVNLSVGNLVMSDGQIDLPGANGVGIYNYAQDVFLQNVYIKAATNIISDVGSPTPLAEPGFSNAWSHVLWYGFRIGTDNGQLLLNGAGFGTSTDAVVSVITTAAASTVPTNLVSMHLWRTNFPSWEDQALVRITDPEFGAIADDPSVDNAPAIQAALDATATLGGPHYGQTVFIPRGHFYLGAPILVPAGAKLIGAAETISILEARADWAPTNTTSILVTADDARGPVTLAFFGIVGNEPTAPYSGVPDMTAQRFLGCAAVQSANLMWRDIQLDQRPGSGFGKQSTQSLATFAGHAGGKVYNLCLDYDGSLLAPGQPDPAFHMIEVRNTTGHLDFYAPDPEHQDQGSASVAISQSGPVSFFAFKYEGSHQLLAASGASQLQVLGGSGNYGQATNSLIAVVDCPDVVLADLCRDAGTNETSGLLWFSDAGAALTDTRPITLLSYGAAGPALAISSAGTQLVLSWPVTTPQFQVQSATAVDGSGSWSQVMLGQVTNTSTVSVSLPLPQAPAFFRLIASP